MSEQDKIADIVRADPRFSRAAYAFVLEAMQNVLEALGERRHVSAAELLEGVRMLARGQFGPLARTVLADWGVQSTADFGHIVFNLIEAGEFRKNESDDLADFVDVFDFEKAFPPDTGDVAVQRDPDPIWDDADADE